MMTELISITPDAERTILYCARVSSNQENEDPSLLRYLIRNAHWSPFEMAHMVVEIRTSRAIAQQILRHRSFSFQEFSQRYAAASNFIVYAGRRKGSTNRQGSVDDLNEAEQRYFIEVQARVAEVAFSAYHDLLDKGIATECARFVLPLSTETKLYMSGSVRSWIHYLQMRTDEHTQFEHREIALSIKDIFVEQLPTIADALGWVKWVEQVECSQCGRPLHGYKHPKGICRYCAGEAE